VHKTRTVQNDIANNQDF